MRQAPGERLTREKRDVVAIGASAGGLSALREVLTTFPADLPATVLVVQHLDPRYPSYMAEILARHAQIAVVEASDGTLLEHGTVYVAPPDRHMLVERDRIRLTTTELVHFVRPSVDLLFESVAAAYGSRAIGVILTGSGQDGSLGVQAIRARGGLTLVQDPIGAESTGMPTSAIATGAVDAVVPLEKIGEAILSAIGQEDESGGDRSR